jgi:hypothetical protein
MLKIIQVHPPEADAIAGAFGRARIASESILSRLNAIRIVLDREWEGNQQVMFRGELGDSLDRISKILLPQLRCWEEKYRKFTVEKVVEVVEKQ